MLLTNRSIFRFAKNAVLLSAIASITMAMPAMANEKDKIPKYLLVKMAADNSNVLCSSEAFTQCMGFTAQRCVELGQEAIDTCLGPLPDSIDPEQLQNESLEACPRKVYDDAGFPEEKAEMCFQEVAGAPPKPAPPVDPTVEPDATTVDEPKEPASPEASD